MISGAVVALGLFMHVAYYFHEAEDSQSKRIMKYRKHYPIENNAEVS